MTVDPFPITQQHNGWLITWPGFSNIKLVENKQKLADLVFDTIGVEEAWFGVRLDDEIKFLHIRFNDWAADRSGRLSDMIEYRYAITGVVFDTEEPARWLQNYFEKRLMWKRLSQPST